MKQALVWGVMVSRHHCSLVCPWFGTNSQLGGVLWVCLCHVLTLVFSLSASTPLSYCLARWLPRYFSTCLGLPCMPGPGACCRGLPFSWWVESEGQESSSSPYFFLPAFSELGDCLETLEVHATMIHCCALLCCVVGLEKRSPCSLIWKMFGLEGTTDGFV